MTLINKPIMMKNIRSTGDIIAGMYRVQQRLNIIPYDYETLKDDLKDKETFFKNKIMPSMRNTSTYAKRQLNWTEGMTVVEYAKLFYGASIPEDKYPKCEFSAEDLEVNKNNIIKFLNQPSNAFSCKNDLDALENESRKIARVFAQQPAQAAPKEGQPAETPKQESMYYSELYQKWFTEAEIEMAEKPAGEQSADGQVQQSSANNEQAKAYKVYMDCYKDIILAKMTAAEFIFNEFTQIINAHINYYKPKAQSKPVEVAPATQPTSPSKK